MLVNAPPSSKSSIIFRLEIARIENSKLKVVLEIARLEKFNARNARDRCFCRSVSTLPAPYPSMDLASRSSKLAYMGLECHWMGESWYSTLVGVGTLEYHVLGPENFVIKKTENFL